MPEKHQGFALGLAGALALAALGCSPYRSGREHYWEGLRTLRYDPAGAAEDFAKAESRLGEALASGRLSHEEQVAAVAIRARCLIELDRSAEVPALVRPAPEGYRPDRTYEGDWAGLALVRSGALDAERAYADLLLAEKRANTLKARQYLVREQVRRLEELGTPQARAEAIKLCALHPGRLDFDEVRKRLQ